MLFGLSGISIFLAYFLTFLSAILCLVYGILNWNKGNSPDEIEQELAWEKEEALFEENL